MFLGRWLSPQQSPSVSMVLVGGFDFSNKTAYLQNMAEKKQGSNIKDYWAKFTPEEAKQKREEQRLKRLKTMADKKSLKAETLRKAQEFMPMAMANNLIAAEDSTWVPDQLTIDRVVQLIQGGMAPEDIKLKLGASDKSWAKISKVIFSSIEPNVQDIGLQLYGAKLDAVKAAKRLVETIQKEIRSHKANQRLQNKNSKLEYVRKLKPTIPNFLLSQLAKATEDKLRAEYEYAKVLQMIGTHDKKNSAPTITIKTTIPRPGEKPVVQEVKEVRRVSLEQAIEELSDGS